MPWQDLIGGLRAARTRAERGSAVEHCSVAPGYFRRRGFFGSPSASCLFQAQSTLGRRRGVCKLLMRSSIKLRLCGRGHQKEKVQC